MYHSFHYPMTLSEVLADVLAESSIHLSINDSIYTFTYDKQTYNIQITGKRKLKFEPKDNTSETMHLINMIATKKFSKVDDALNLAEYLRAIIPKLTSYCVGCQEMLEFQSEEFITCGKRECDYEYENMQFGNPVVDQVKYDQDLARFLLESSFEAAKCKRKYDIFEPFPTHYLKKGAEGKIVRGDISKLSGIELDDYKDFTRLNKVIKEFDIDRFFTVVEMCSTDEEVEKVFGSEIYYLVRFIFMSCKVNIELDSLLKKTAPACKVYRIKAPLDKEQEFVSVKSEVGESCYLFHGSRWQNWYSILRNGLKNCSHTKLMTAGAAYGNGIYLSDNTNLSYNYGASGNKSVIGVFEVVGEKTQFQKGRDVYVCPDGKYLIQRYLLIIPTNSRTISLQEINKVFNASIYVEQEKVITALNTKGIKKLVKQYKRILKTQKNNPDELGFRVTVNENDSYIWSVFITQFDSNEAVGKDMEELGIKEIELELRFPNTYPLDPPFVRVIKPRFKQLTGHVTSAGALCMELLTSKGWSSATSIEALIITIKSEILEGGGRIDRDKWNMPYTLNEAKKSFVRVAMGHGWM